MSSSLLIQVDFESLRQIAQRFEQVKQELSGSDLRHEDDAGLQNRRISVALDDFCDTWSRKGQENSRHVGRAARYLRRVADAMERADSTLGQHLPVPPTPVRPVKPVRPVAPVRPPGPGVPPGGGGASPAGGSAASIAVAEAKAKVRESGSNRGSRVEEYQRTARTATGVPWCAAFVTWCLVKSGWKQPPGNWAYCPNWVASARAGRNGMRVIDPSQAGPGDVIVYDWQGDGTFDHIGMVTGKANGGTIPSVEGNTGSPEGVWNKNGGAARGARKFVVIRIDR